MERYHIFKLGLAILFYAAYCIRPMLVNGLRSANKAQMKPEDYLVFYQVQDGIPGVDFPILSNIPRTTFSCQNIESGYYADLDTDCQVFHICEEGRKISFLCPNGTIFDQSDLICEWWFKVNCSNSPNLYHESAELLRGDIARRKASRKVYLNGQESNHGAVMRVEESSSITAKKGSKSFSPGTSNAITSNGYTRTSQGGPRKPQSSSAIDQQKPKRYNDADTGNYVNKVDEGSNIKDNRAQLSRTSPALDTASSERHVQVRSTTPSSLNSVSSSQGQSASKNQLNGSRGRIKFRPSIGNEDELSSGHSADEYDLDFPKHRSEIASEQSRTTTPINIDSTRVDLGVQAELRGRVRVSDSDELQVPQETAAFTKNSYNSLRTSTRKHPTVNPYPNHRATYSELKKPTLPTPRSISSINSVTPQYITTQPINNGKPFVGSTVGINIYGTKLRTSTLEPETSPFGRHISSTFNPIRSTTQTPLVENPEQTTTFVSRFSVSSTTPPSVEHSTTGTFDRATVYGSFSKDAETTSVPPRQVDVTFGKDEDTLGVQLTKSVGDEPPKYGSPVKPPLVDSDAVVHISDVQGNTLSSTVRNDISHDLRGLSGTESPLSSTPDYQNEDNYRFDSTTTPSARANAGTIGTAKPTIKSYYPSSTVNDIQDTTESRYDVPSGVDVNFGSNQNKAGIQLSKSVSSEIPKYGSSVKPPLLKSDAVVHTSDVQGSIPSSTVRSGILRDTTEFSTTENSLPTTDVPEIEDIYFSTTTSPVIGNDGTSGTTGKNEYYDKTVKPTPKPYYTSTTVNDIQSTTESEFGGTTSSSPKFSTTDNDVFSYQNTASNPPGSTEGSTLRSVVPPRTDLISETNVQSSLAPNVDSQGQSGILSKPSGSESTRLAGSVGSFPRTTGRPFAISQADDGGSTIKPDSFDSIDVGSPKYSTPLPDVLNSDSSTIGYDGGEGYSTPPSDRGAIYEVFTERTEVPTGHSTVTDQPVGVTLRGKPFTLQGHGDEVVPGRPSEGKTDDSSLYQPTLRGSPFTKAKDDGAIYEVFTHSTPLAPTGQPIRTTIQPISTVTGRGRPFGYSQSTDGASVTTVQPSVNTGTIRERPLKTVDSAVEGTEYEISAENPQISTVQPGSTTAEPFSSTDARGRPSDISRQTNRGNQPSLSNSGLSTESSISSSDQLVRDATTLAPIVSETPKYGSAVNPPLIKTDAFIHVSDLQSTSRPTEGTLSQTSDIANEDNKVQSPASEGKPTFFHTSTAAPLTGTTRTYGSTGVPPLTRAQSSSQLRGGELASNTGDTPVKSNDKDTFGNKIKPEFSIVSSTPLPDLKSFVQLFNNGESQQKQAEDVPKYSGFDTNASKPTNVPYSEENRTIRGDVSSPSQSVSGSTLAPDVVAFTGRVKSTITYNGDKRLPYNKVVSGDANISQNYIGSTLAPDVSFAGRVKLKPTPHTGEGSYSGFKNTSKGSYPGDNKTLPSSSNIAQNTTGSALRSDVAFGQKLKPTITSHEGKGPEGPGFYVTKNSVYGSSTSSPLSVSSTVNYEQSTPFVKVSPHSGTVGIKPLETTLSAPKVESSFEKEVPLVKSETQWPRPFQRPNSLQNKERATYLPTESTESTTSTYVTYKISSARPFMLPEGTPAPTLPSPFTAATSPQSSVYENVDNMINMLKEIVNATDQDFSSETPRPGLVVPPSAGPQTLHTLAVYFANALDGIAAEREKLTGEELDEENKEKLTSLLTQMTMYRYKELFKGGEEDIENEATTLPTSIEDDSENLIQAPGLRQLARNFSLALSSYLDDPESFRKDLQNLRPTEPPQLSEDATDAAAGEEELLNFSDADAKPSFPPTFPTVPSVSPTWGYIVAPKGSADLDVKNTLNPDLHTADTQSFVPGFNNLPASAAKGFTKDRKSNKGIPVDHWTDSPGATKLWQTAFSVNPAIVNDHFVTTEPTLLDTTDESSEKVAEPSLLPNLDIPQSEFQYDLRALPKVSVNSTEVRGLLIDFINTTKADETNRLQRLLRKLNTTESEFLSRMKEIDSNPLTKRLILLLISECGTNATKDIAEAAEHDLWKETLEPSQSSSSVASYSEGRHNSDVPELVDPNLPEDDQDTRALQLLNSLYTIAAKFGK